MLLEDTANDFDGWQGLVSDSFVPLDTEPQRRGGFRGRISARDYDSVVMSQVNANPHAVLRTPELIARARSQAHGRAAGTNYFKVSLQLDGHGLLIQDGREMALAPGSLAIYDTSRPYTLSFDSDFSSYVMMFPQSRVNLPPGTVGQLTATPIGADHQLGAVAAQVISQAGAMLPSLNRATGVRLAGNVVDLLTTVMADELSPRAAMSTNGSDCGPISPTTSIPTSQILTSRRRPSLPPTSSRCGPCTRSSKAAGRPWPGRSGGAASRSAGSTSPTPGSDKPRWPPSAPAGD